MTHEEKKEEIIKVIVRKEGIEKLGRRRVRGSVGAGGWKIQEEGAG